VLLYLEKIKRTGLAGTLLRYNHRLMKAIHPATILAVDDSDAQLYFVSRVLRHAGFEVRETKSGSDTLKMAEDQPDLIVLDVSLPDVNGFEICKRLKANPKTARTFPWCSCLPSIHRRMEKPRHSTWELTNS
jgi:PleD family two-component response regulator